MKEHKESRKDTSRRLNRLQLQITQFYGSYVSPNETSLIRLLYTPRTRKAYGLSFVQHLKEKMTCFIRELLIKISLEFHENLLFFVYGARSRSAKQ